ncbi:MAG: cytochrome P450 [Burkholderiales bacterium]|nr:cytochrome P450 [Burkholderiales bacterium]
MPPSPPDAPLDLRPESPEFRRDPYPMLARLRAEDPVHWSPRLKGWVLTRYDDVRAALLDARLSSDRLRPFFAALAGEEAARIAHLARYLSLWMVFRDPPDHTRLRRLAGRVFSLAAMSAMRPAVEALVERLLDRLDGRREIDFVADFAGPLPALVVMAMLGVPEEELARVKRLSDELALFIGSARTEGGKYARAERAAAEMADFFAALIAERRRAPGADLLSALVRLEHEGDRLGEDELLATCILLLFAGHETTTNLLANGLAALLRFPGEMAKLRAQPALAPRAVEELLRYDGPSIAQVRVVAVAHELRGRRLAAGERVFLMLNAANRDPEVYDEPDRLRLERGGPAHLAFGFGPHLCLGFPLARLEAQVAIPAVLRRWREIALAVPEEAIEWHDSLVFRGMTRLPLAVAPA